MLLRNGDRGESRSVVRLWGGEAGSALPSPTLEASLVPDEILIVDDGSTDGTREILKELEQQPGVRVILHERNSGKGAAVRTGIQAAEGDVMLIQDADLEYDPRDYPVLLKPIREDIADVVYGSRFLGGRAVRSSSGTWSPINC